MALKTAQQLSNDATRYRVQASVKNTPKRCKRVLSFAFGIERLRKGASALSLKGQIVVRHNIFADLGTDLLINGGLFACVPFIKYVIFRRAICKSPPSYVVLGIEVDTLCR